MYERLADGGYVYGPVFQGLRAVWRSERDVYAEVTLPEEVETGGFGLHPAVLDAALHPIGLTGLLGEDDGGGRCCRLRGVGCGCTRPERPRYESGSHRPTTAVSRWRCSTPPASRS